MEWTVSELNTRVKRYNKKYFNNEIELPIVVKLSKQLFNSKSNILAYCRLRDSIHEIVLSAKLLNASDEIIKHVLVHELVHAWQDEHDQEADDNFSEVQGHGPAFIEKCEELNSKFRFRYPIQRYMGDRGISSIERSSSSVYYVYKMTHSKVEPSLVFPIGVFVKLLYKDEIVHLQNRGLSVKYYSKAIFTHNVDLPVYRNKIVAQTDALVTYNNIKNSTKDNLIQHVLDIFSWSCVFTDDDFNYQDGVEAK